MRLRRAVDGVRGALFGLVLLMVWSAHAQSGGPEGTVLGPHFDDAQAAQYTAGMEAYRKGDYPAALATFSRLARANPCCGVLGMVVASLASTAPSPAQARVHMDAADRAPDDVFAQFVAGAYAHYAAHHSGRTVPEKRALYERAIVYLGRTLPAYDAEPRVYIYLAVSHFRLQQQEAAERYIEQAVERGRDDPDAYYCRAEIFQRKDIRRSVADIDHYVAAMRAAEAQGAVGSEAKMRRVLAMREHLVAVSEGRASPREIFDPVAAEAAAESGTQSTTTEARRRPRRPSVPSREEVPEAALLVTVAVAAGLSRRAGSPQRGSTR